MKLHMLLLIALAAALAACGEKEQVAAPTESETEAPEAAAVETPGAEVLEEVEEAVEEAVDDTVEDAPDTTLADIQEWRNEDLLDQMHAHAEQLDDLNFALDDGDLFRAKTSAYWLARRDVIEGLPDELQPYFAGMRDAARVVEDAEDIDAAKAAAKRIGEQCQGCHEAADVTIS